MSGGEKTVSPCESDKQPLIICHVKIVSKIVILEELLTDTNREKKKKKGYRVTVL